MWHVAVNTDMAPPADIWEAGMEKKLENQNEFVVGPRSVVILVAK